MNDSLLAHMASNGIEIIGIINFNNPNFQRFKDASFPNKPHAIWVKILGNGEAALYGSWRDNIEFYWRNDKVKVLFDFREVFKRKAAKKKLEADRLQSQHSAANKAAELYFNAPEASTEMPYVLRKKIIPYNARAHGNTILLPLYSANGQISSLQYIYSNGSKMFLKDGVVQGSALILCDKPISEPPIRICEGWATGCTLFEYTREPIFVAFTAANVIRVAEQFKDYPLIIYADADETGMKAAKQIASFSNAIIKSPIFPDKKPHLTDWNDLHCFFGKETLLDQIN
jgi:putative DNA primase/helicase